VEAFIQGLPKAELHIHIEGTLEPELLLKLADRNEVEVQFGSVAEVQAAYRFTSLQSFLDIYYVGARVLRTEQDFSDLMYEYLERVHSDGVRHAEIFFDPQTHTARGVPFPVFMDGFGHAQARAFRELGISTSLICCFLRHLPAGEAMHTLEQALPFGERIVAVGLDSSEVGHPPGEFADVFARARAEGFRAVAHAGEEGPPSYITGALDLLGAERIDHGVRSVEDEALLERLVAERVPLTMCPLSNQKLQVTPDLTTHPLRRLLERGVMVTVNSDDPAYFG
jgi:adenosine deaminase